LREKVLNWTEILNKSKINVNLNYIIYIW
jgi:hypothetical protein